MDIRKWLSNKKTGSSGSSKDIVEAELPQRDLVQSELTPPAREDVPAAAGASCSTISARMGQQPPPAPPFNATAPDDLGTEGPAQDELDETTCVWDSHVIRPSKNDRVPSGRPKVMYMFPELYTTEDCVSPVEGADAQLCRSNCTFRPAVPCDTDIYNICNLLMMESQLNLPADSYQALDLYLDLRNTIRSSL
ncbi:Myomesin-1 [Dissostichus eleginoides]|uniref:Myomesin-1 n=2 Tax=Dissostichus eleginoides TaxID=100907 RepID=A0AAD9C7F9_DISEL|nr:Myomesin-1 [Dissostichus eleginoides]